MTGMWVSSNGAWKKVTGAWVSSNGSWKKVTTANVSVSGAWKKTFSPGVVGLNLTYTPGPVPPWDPYYVEIALTSTSGATGANIYVERTGINRVTNLGYFSANASGSLNAKAYVSGLIPNQPVKFFARVEQPSGTAYYTEKLVYSPPMPQTPQQPTIDNIYEKGWASHTSAVPGASSYTWRSKRISPNPMSTYNVFPGGAKDATDWWSSASGETWIIDVAAVAQGVTGAYSLSKSVTTPAAGGYSSQFTLYPTASATYDDQGWKFHSSTHCGWDNTTGAGWQYAVYFYDVESAGFDGLRTARLAGATITKTEIYLDRNGAGTTTLNVNGTVHFEGSATGTIDYGTDTSTAQQFNKSTSRWFDLGTAIGYRLDQFGAASAPVGIFMRSIGGTATYGEFGNAGVGSNGRIRVTVA